MKPELFLLKLLNREILQAIVSNTMQLEWIKFIQIIYSTGHFSLPKWKTLFVVDTTWH